MVKLTLNDSWWIPPGAVLSITSPSNKSWWQFWIPKIIRSEVQVYRRSFKEPVVYVRSFQERTIK